MSHMTNMCTGNNKLHTYVSILVSMQVKLRDIAEAKVVTRILNQSPLCRQLSRLLRSFSVSDEYH